MEKLMSIGNLNFDDIKEENLNELIDVGVPEGFTIEYKRDLYRKSDSDKREALKDISSFGNSFGGHLIIGIKEDNGIPISIAGLQNINPDSEISRLENLIRDGIEPRITGIKVKAISIKAGGFVIAIRIPKSWNPPHRVSARNFNRFYIRNSAGVHEVSVEELRTLFNFSATVHDRIQSFRKERLAILSADEGPKRIEHEGRLILHIVPLSAFSHYQLLDVKRIYDQNLFFWPIAASGNTPRFNFEGFINFSGGEKCYGYTQIFRNGVIEATMASIIVERNGEKFLPGLPFDKDIFKVLPKYLNGLKVLDVPPPLVVMISLQEVNGACLVVSSDRFDGVGNKFNKSELLLPEIVIEDYGTDESYEKAMRPAFDALWNAAGYAASGYFNDDDLWVGK
jgi:hypothetical protein